MTRCPRCGDPTERYSLRQTHCRRCEDEVARLIAADARRHVSRWPIAKEIGR